MDFKKLVYSTRTTRRFHQNKAIAIETLRALVDLARVSPCASNRQRIAYAIANEPALNTRIFPSLSWAAALPDWDGPSEGERPAAYILILDDTERGKGLEYDFGIAAQTILLAAREKGIAGCIFAAVKREELAKSVNLPSRYRIPLVIALGMPAESVEIAPIPASGSIDYWREDATHFVPKRALDDVIVNLK